MHIRVKNEGSVINHVGSIDLIFHVPKILNFYDQKSGQKDWSQLLTTPTTTMTTHDGQFMIYSTLAYMPNKPIYSQPCLIRPSLMSYLR